MHGLIRAFAKASPASMMNGLPRYTAGERVTAV